MSALLRLRVEIAGGLALLVIGYFGGHLTRADVSAQSRSPAVAPAVQNSVTTTADAEKSAPAFHSPSSSVSTSGGSVEAALQALAERDPARALAQALQERNRLRRIRWIQAVLRGWASVAPDEAVAWVGTLPSAEREAAEAAAMDGVSRDPAAAVALAERLIQNDPNNARAHANQLLRALGDRDRFEDGVAFATRLPEAVRAEMLGTAFQYWAREQPERAYAEAAKFPEGDTRRAALDAAISGWAEGDPAGLADFALKLSPTADRAEVLQTALREWVRADPHAAVDWIVQRDPAPELDAGAAAVALQPEVLGGQPELAARWAENITADELRSSTLANVLRAWAEKDATASLSYASRSPLLQPSDRAALVKEIGAASPSL